LLILGIESSCDETAASIVEDGVRVRSSIISSQVDLHEGYGGVVPEIASRAHVERMLPVIETALREAGATYADIDAVAFANRPGLIGALLVGLAAAKSIAWSMGKPLVGVHHIQAHLYAGLLDNKELSVEDAFPALGLAVSGGHTALYHCHAPSSMERLGSTIDDAVGEAYDKAASILGLGYPGGPIVDKRARMGDPGAHDFPVSRLAAGSLDFSFSGLKTALLYAVKGRPLPDNSGKATFAQDHTELFDPQIDNFCASFQRAAVEALMVKLERAHTMLCEQGEPPRSILLGGGVAANSRLREQLSIFAETTDIPVAVPPIRYCLDNAAMVAGLAAQILEHKGASALGLTASPTGADLG
jgi:N6-L-threonylcarbamoyladenine synthase